MSCNIELTEEERINLKLRVLDIESLTERWERKLCYEAMVEAVKWGKKVDAANKEYRKKNKQIKKM